MNPIEIRVPEKLPTRITPCPIVEAVLEVRFVTERGWTVLPGLLHQHIRDRYREPEDLPLAAMPEKFRESQSQFTYQPLASFAGEGFSVGLGPRVLSLAVTGEYPGWSVVNKELDWLLAKVEAANFISEGERIGIRYVDFFECDLFPNLEIQPHCHGEPLTGFETSLTIAFRRERFTARLILHNSVSVKTDEGPRSGSVFDLDLSLAASDFDLFEDGRNRFREAHRLNKEIFFGLMKPEFLSTLSPTYD